MESNLDKLAFILDDDQCKKIEEFCKKDQVFKLWVTKVYVYVSIWIAGENLKR